VLFVRCLVLVAALSSFALAGVRKLQPGAGPTAWQNDLAPVAASDWNYERAAQVKAQHRVAKLIGQQRLRAGLAGWASTIPSRC
jgi:hypothetical protein